MDGRDRPRAPRDAPSRLTKTVSLLFDDPEARRRLRAELADDAESRRLLERIDQAAASGDSGDFLATGGALGGPAWHRIAERLVGPGHEPGQRIDRYVLLEEIGVGGMGAVWAAWDPELDRKVAIKLLFPLAAESSADQRERLLGEARALARLAHPNVVAVHDAGVVDGQVFLAMEHVAGIDLAAWIAAGSRGWREILARFLEAGEGLAAAHEAGILHRDFKPQNVLVGDDGRVRVADFGLARDSGGDTPPRPRRVAGTPAYMAPEQLRGEAQDERSDQFAFAVALWESLFGGRPYPGDSVAAIAERLESGAPPELPAGSRVPRHVARILQRALELDPEKRWPSLRALLGVLARDRRRAWRRAGVFVALPVGAAVVALLVANPGAEPCSGFGTLLADDWNGTRAQGLEERFVTAGFAPASAEWQRTRAALDAWVRDWVGERESACAATRVYGEQSEERLGLRTACLDRRRRELGALIALFEEADAGTLLEAPNAALALDSPRVCADAELLEAPVRPPTDPARMATLRDLEDRAARVKALRDAGRLEDAADAAEEALVPATELAFAPISAELHLLAADVAERRQELDRVESAAFAAWSEAEQAGHDEVVLQSLSLLVFYEGNDRFRPDAARRWAALAEARLGRLVGGAPHLAAQLASDYGSALQVEGDLDEALAQHSRALELRTQLFGPESADVARTLNNLGSVLFAQGRFEEAARRYRRSAALLETLLGPEHPSLSMALNNLGATQIELRRPDEARSALTRALAIRESRFGPGAPLTAISRGNLASVALQDDPAAAVEPLRRARRDLLAVVPETHPVVAQVDASLGLAYLLTGDPARARDLLDSALTRLEEGGGAPRLEFAKLRFDVARARWASGDRSSETLDLARRALEDVRSLQVELPGLPAEIGAWLAERGDGGRAAA